MFISGKNMRKDTNKERSLDPHPKEALNFLPETWLYVAQVRCRKMINDVVILLKFCTGTRA